MRKTLARYGVALAWVALATAIRHLLGPVLGHSVPFILYLPAALMTSWVAGWQAGVVALVVGFVVGDLLFIGPGFRLGPYGPAELTTLIVSLVSGLIGIFVVERLQATRTNLDTSQAEERVLREEVGRRIVAEEAASRQRDKLQLAAAIVADLLVSTDPAGVIGRFFDRLSKHIQADTYFSYVLANGDSLQLHSYAGIPEESAQELSHMELGQAVSGLVAQTKQPCHVEAVQQSTDPRVAVIKRLGLRSYVCNPMVVEDRLLGTLSFGSRSKDQFAAEEIEFIKTFSIYTALALDRARLLAESKTRASELEKARDALANYARDLEARVAERTARLQESVRSLEGVLYHVAHDLRAPIRAMHGLTGIILETYAPKFDDYGRECAERVQESCSRMDALIQDLLAYGRLCQQPVLMEPVDLGAVLEHVISQESVVANCKRAQVHVQKLLPKVWADRDLLTRVLAEVLANACAFAAPIEPQVDVSAEIVGSSVRLTVEDNGMGIDAAYHERIFNVFERLEPDVSNEKTGMGLAIAKKGMERMNGNIGVSSVPGQGARFWLELPVASPNV